MDYLGFVDVLSICLVCLLDNRVLFKRYVLIFG